MDPILDWGVEVVLWFQQYSPALDGLFKAFTFLGDTEFYLILLPLVYWSIDRAIGVRLVVIALFSSLVNTVAKSIGGQPRPFTFDERVDQLVSAHGNGLPSGHTQSAVVIWGFASLEIRRRWMWLVASVLIVGVGISRVYLGVHFPTDVLGGALIGLAVLIVWGRYGAGAERWFCQLRMATQLAMIVLVPLAVMAAFPDEDAVTAGATLIGMGSGILLERRSLRFSTVGSFLARTGRFIIGGAILVGIWWGLRTLLAGLEPALLLRLVRYTVVGFWGAFGAPWMFLKLGLAQRESHTAVRSSEGW